jgi:hypothetical protein
LAKGRDKVLWKPDIFAEITLFPCTAGGRKGSTPSDCFGCPADIDGHYYDVRFDLSEVGSMLPGQTTIVPAKFLNPQIKKSLAIGMEFTLWEGKDIGTGRVVEICGNS